MTWNNQIGMVTWGEWGISIGQPRTHPNEAGLQGYVSLVVMILARSYKLLMPLSAITVRWGEVRDTPRGGLPIILQDKSHELLR